MTGLAGEVCAFQILRNGKAVLRVNPAVQWEKAVSRQVCPYKAGIYFSPATGFR